MSSENDKQPPSSDTDAKSVNRQTPTSREPLCPKVWSSTELFGDEVEVFIAHGGQLYRLRQTRNGKLILCK